MIKDIPSRLKSKPLLVVLLTLFVDMLGYGILIPIVPQLLGNQDSPYSILPQSYSLDQGYILLGFLVGIFPLMQFFATPILGQLSDRHGRRKILALSLTGTCLSHLAFAYAVLTRNIPLLFISRAVDGITGGNISVAHAAIADISTPDDRAKNFALTGAAFGLGFIIGPYIGGKLSDANLVSWFNTATPFWFAALISFINVIFVLTLFPETLRTLRLHVPIEWFKSVRNVAKAYILKPVRIPFLTTFLFQSGFTFFTTFFSIYLIRRFNFSQGNIGEYFAYIGLWMALSQIFITPKITKLFTEAQILRVSIIGAGLLIAAHFLPHNPSSLLFIAPFFAMFIGFTQANLTALISRSVGPDIQGETLGINSSVNALAQAVPPIISGYIAATLHPNAPLIVGSITLGVAGIIFIIFYRQSQWEM